MDSKIIIVIVVLVASFISSIVGGGAWWFWKDFSSMLGLGTNKTNKTGGDSNDVGKKKTENVSSAQPETNVTSQYVGKRIRLIPTYENYIYYAYGDDINVIEPNNIPNNALQCTFDWDVEFRAGERVSLKSPGNNRYIMVNTNTNEIELNTQNFTTFDILKVGNDKLLFRTGENQYLSTNSILSKTPFKLITIKDKSTWKMLEATPSSECRFITPK